MLKAVLDSIDELSEELKAHYTEKDGKFYLGVETVNGWALEDVTNLRKALQSDRTKAESLERKLKSFVDADGNPLEPDKVLEALAKVAEMSTWKPEQKVQELIEAREARLTGQHEKLIGERDTTIEELTRELERAMVQAGAAMEIQKLGAFEGTAEVLMPHIQRDAKVRRRDDGKYEVVIVDETGSPRMSMKSGATGNMTLDEFVGSFKEHPSFKPFFKGTDASGGGTTSGGSHGTDKIDPSLPAEQRLAEARRLGIGT